MFLFSFLRHSILEQCLKKTAIRVVFDIPTKKRMQQDSRWFFQGHEHELLHRLHLVANDDGESIGKEGAESRGMVAAKACRTDQHRIQPSDFKVADLSPIHFRKQSHRWYVWLMDLNIGCQGLAAWFWIKSTTIRFSWVSGRQVICTSGQVATHLLCGWLEYASLGQVQHAATRYRCWERFNDSTPNVLILMVAGVLYQSQKQQKGKLYIFITVIIILFNYRGELRMFYIAS